MPALDSSVAIAAFASWHEMHHDARSALREAPQLIAHAALETYSVLTRLPPPHRASADVVGTYLAAQFPGPWLTLRDADHVDLIRRLAAKSITGGKVYDALIGTTAAAHDATLLTCDRRAATTYDAVGATVRFIG